MSLSRSAPSKLPWREGGGDAWRREGKANPTHNSAYPFLKGTTSWGFLCTPQPYFPVLCAGTTKVSPQALNCQWPAPANSQDTVGRTCLPSPTRCCFVTFDLSLLTPQVFRVGFHSPGGASGSAEVVRPTHKVPVTSGDLSCQHLFLPQG